MVLRAFSLGSLESGHRMHRFKRLMPILPLIHELLSQNSLYTVTLQDVPNNVWPLYVYVHAGSWVLSGCLELNIELIMS